MRRAENVGDSGSAVVLGGWDRRRGRLEEVRFCFGVLLFSCRLCRACQPGFLVHITRAVFIFLEKVREKDIVAHCNTFRLFVVNIILS